MTAALPAAGKNVKQHTVRVSGRGHVISSSLFFFRFSVRRCFGCFFVWCVCVCVCVRQSSTTDCVTVFCVWQLPRLLVWQNGFFFSFFFLLKPRLLLWFNAWEHLCQGLNYSHAEAESKIRTETHWPFFFFFFFLFQKKPEALHETPSHPATHTDTV